jgi:hypothetical protein
VRYGNRRHKERKSVVNKEVYYGAETWTQTAVEENALGMLEGKIIRRIYRSVTENNIYRIRYKEEINTLPKGEDKARFIESQRLKWLGHVKRTEDNAVPKRMIKGKLYSRRRKGRPRLRWLEEVESDLKRMKVTGWKEKMRNREQWRLAVEEARAHPGL